MLWNDTMETILATVIAEAREDLVGVWTILSWVRSAFPTLDAETTRSVTLTIIERALSSEIVEAGSFAPAPSKAFETWKLNAASSVHRIERAWRELGRDPDIGDNLWLIGKETHYVPST